MNCHTKISCCVCFSIAMLVTVGGCRQSVVKSVPTSTGEATSATITAENAGDQAEDASAAESTIVGIDGAADVHPQADVDTNTDAETSPAAAHGPEAVGLRNADAETDSSTQAMTQQVAGPATIAASSPASEQTSGSDQSPAVELPTRESQPRPRDLPPTERVILLTPGGPLVVDIEITIDGDVHSSALEALVDDAFAAADVDGDGQRTWEEVANSPRFMYGQFGNLPITDDAQKSQLITMYDRNADGLVDRDEVPRFVTRNVGRSRSFSLRSSNEFRSASRSRSPLRQLLDFDHNGAITSDEMAAAPARLLSQDADDDQIVTLADFKDDAQATPGRMSNRRRTTEPETAILINDRTKWNSASYILQELYSFGDTVQASDWPLTPELFATLDTDRDARLGSAEVEQLATVRPHLRLRAQFGIQDAEGGSRKTSLELDVVDPAIEALVTSKRSYARRVSIELTGVEVEFFVNEDPALNNYEEVAQGQFSTLDTDGNGYLEASEVPNQLPGLDIPFAGVDANQDDKIEVQELANFLNLRQRAYRGQVRARAADQEDALFTALDTNGDGRIHARELAATPDLLAKMDSNQDGDLQSHEIPGSMVVGLVRGNPQQDDTLFVMPTETTDASSQNVPRWFLGMDTNRDGEVGRHEFLGASNRFDTLDKNADGFISPAELPPEMLGDG